MMTLILRNTNLLSINSCIKEKKMDEIFEKAQAILTNRRMKAVSENASDCLPFSICLPL